MPRVRFVASAVTYLSAGDGLLFLKTEPGVKQAKHRFKKLKKVGNLGLTKWTSGGNICKLSRERRRK